MPTDNTIIDFLKKNAAKDSVSFHMPGHKSRPDWYAKCGYESLLRDAISYDITEIPGADALYHPESTIKSVMNNYAELYGVKHTELLVNGSSAGIIAALLCSVPVGGKLIMGRNSHHSAFSALRLGAINPIYVQPETDETYGLSAEISPYSLEDACKSNPDASAVFITSPNYCGMLSDISLLADIAHDHGMLLIVDQAHGAHLRFFDYDAKAARDRGDFVPHIYHSAESLGADIVINSTHKTLFSFTQSAVLNICTEGVDADALSEYLRILQSTSPSYVLMASLDVNERIMRSYGREIISEWKSDLEFFYRNASRIDGLKTVKPYGYKGGADISKINISMAELGIDGDKLDRELRYKGIYSEMVHGEYLLLMTGAGNVRSDYERLLDALKSISDSYGITCARQAVPQSFNLPQPDMGDVPIEYETVPLYQSDGRAMYSPIISYPPGSPIICPGEIMSMEIISHISDILDAGDRISGVDEEGNIKVGI